MAEDQDTRHNGHVVCPLVTYVLKQEKWNSWPHSAVSVGCTLPVASRSARRSKQKAQESEVDMIWLLAFGFLGCDGLVE